MLLLKLITAMVLDQEKSDMSDIYLLRRFADVSYQLIKNLLISHENEIGIVTPNQFTERERQKSSLGKSIYCNEATYLFFLEGF